MRTVKLGPIYTVPGQPDVKYRMLVIRRGTDGENDTEDNYYNWDHDYVTTFAITLSAMDELTNRLAKVKPLDDGTNLSGYVWVRVQFTTLDGGPKIHNYTLYANGMSPQNNLVSEVLGVEYMDGADIEELPQCLSVPIRMMLVRGRGTDTSMFIADTKCMWFYNLDLTVEDLLEITGRNRWGFEHNNAKLFNELVEVLSTRESIEGSA